jgi:hypothetical protein
LGKVEEFLKAEGGRERRKDDEELEGSMDKKDEDKKQGRGVRVREKVIIKSVDGGVSYGSAGHTFVCSADPRPTNVKRRLALAKESAWETGLNLPPIRSIDTATNL